MGLFVLRRQTPFPLVVDAQNIRQVYAYEKSQGHVLHCGFCPGDTLPHPLGKSKAARIGRRR